MQYSGSKEGEPYNEIFFSRCDGFAPCEGCFCFNWQKWVLYTAAGSIQNLKKKARFVNLLVV
jgi:hypothetical protein